MAARLGVPPEYTPTDIAARFAATPVPSLYAKYSSVARQVTDATAKHMDSNARPATCDHWRTSRLNSSNGRPNTMVACDSNSGTRAALAGSTPAPPSAMPSM
jgi:hypothetical protein